MLLCGPASHKSLLPVSSSIRENDAPQGIQVTASSRDPTWKPARRESRCPARPAAVSSATPLFLVSSHAANYCMVYCRQLCTIAVTSSGIFHVAAQYELYRTAANLSAFGQRQLHFLKRNFSTSVTRCSAGQPLVHQIGVYVLPSRLFD